MLAAYVPLTYTQSHDWNAWATLDLIRHRTWFIVKSDFWYSLQTANMEMQELNPDLCWGVCWYEVAGRPGASWACCMMFPTGSCHVNSNLVTFLCPLLTCDYTPGSCQLDQAILSTWTYLLLLKRNSTTIDQVSIDQDFVALYFSMSTCSAKIRFLYSRRESFITHKTNSMLSPEMAEQSNSQKSMQIWPQITLEKKETMYERRNGSRLHASSVHCKFKNCEICFEQWCSEVFMIILGHYSKLLGILCWNTLLK